MMCRRQAIAAVHVDTSATMYCYFGFRPKRLNGDENTGANPNDAIASMP